MPRVVAAFALLFAFAPAAQAQLDSPLRLVRKLAEAGLVDLATQRLEELQAKPKLLSPAESVLVPYELALIRLEEAAREGDQARRTNLVNQARTGFESFVQKNPNHPLTAEAGVKIARLYALQAKGSLSRARRSDNAEARKAAVARTRPEFTTAINRHRAAISALENRIKTLDAKDPLVAELQRSIGQAELDAAALQYDLAYTYGEGEGRQKGDGIDAAKKSFDAIASAYPQTRIGHLATVWSEQCRYANGEMKPALEALTRFQSNYKGNRDAADALRLAAYFGIEHAFDADAGPKETDAAKFVRAEQAAAQWLQRYPDARTTPEGLGARYRRATMKEAQALLPGGIIFAAAPKPKTNPKDPPKEQPRKIVGITPNAKALLEEANKIYRELTETDNEYSERAHRRRLQNQLILLDAEGRGDDPPLRAIRTLEQGYLAAQVQQARLMALDPNLEEKARETQVRDRVRKAIGYLDRGLQRATPADSARDLFDARLLLVQFLIQSERPMEAAVLGEGLARGNPKLARASSAAAMGVLAYNAAYNKARQAGGSPEDEATDLKRLRALADFAQTNYAADGPTDAVRHVVGFHLMREKKYDEAWAIYSKIGTGYADLYQARRELGAVMFYLVRPEERDPRRYREIVAKQIQDRTVQWQGTLAALEALPELSANATAHDAEAWAGAKSMQAQLAYLANDFGKVDAVVKAVAEALPKAIALDDKKRDDLIFTARAIRYNALQARAIEFARAREFAKVGDTLGAELTATREDLKKTAPAQASPGLDRMRKAQRDFLMAAMSAFVQNKQVDKAGEILETLQTSGGSVESNVSQLQPLLNGVRSQIDTLNREQKKDEADEVAKSFTEFLDKLAGDDPGKLNRAMVLFLGQGYSTVDQHVKAAQLFDGLAKRAFENTGKTEDEKAEQEKANTAFRRELHFRQARAYRLAGGKENFDKAMALMGEIVGEPIKPKGTRGWGYANIEIRKEYCMLLEDQKLFGSAGQNWQLLLRDFVPRGALPAPVKFLSDRPRFLATAQAADDLMAEVFLMPTRSAGILDVGFKNVFPGLANRRNQIREVYFELFYEQYRCSARAYATVGAKNKPADFVDQKMAEYGQKFHELLTRNDDVPAEVRDKVKELIAKYPAMKKKFDELAAAGPKS